jgi:hypothetical protein
MERIISQFRKSAPRDAANDGKLNSSFVSSCWIAANINSIGGDSSSSRSSEGKVKFTL